ncbi:MAG: ATP-dependent helicase [Candidatus Dormibacteraeota bacterium]|nr:ATP-dependent helicase [Candidatus Dormibacteraeota bacterium]
MTVAASRHSSAAPAASLNEQQRAAVEHRSGPLLVIAGAGTGKTMTLAHRVAHLIDCGTPPERILLLTFSRRAAAEMLSRAQSLTRDGGTRRVWGGTFHAVAAHLLRLHGRAVGVQPDFTVLDRSDTADLLNLVRSALTETYERKRFARKETLADIYSRTVNAGAPLREVLQRCFPWCAADRGAIASIFTAYTQRKRASNVLDFDDLLLFWRALMASPAAERVAERFDHVLVDEYQDVNALQAAILAGLHRTIADVFVVGDDAQAIYSFRSATVDHILDFPRLFEGTRIVPLEQNYRSTSPLLAASNAVIALARARHEKTLVAVRPGGVRPQLITCRDELAQSDAVCDSVLRLREQGIALHRQAVLFRTSHHSDLLEIELGRRNIPFVKYGGLKFLEAAHVKDVLALLRVLDNPRDAVSWFRVLQLLEGVGPVHASRLMTSIGVDGAATTPSPLRALVEGDVVVPDAARPSMTALRALIDELSVERDPVPLASQIERIRRFCEPVFARLYGNAEVRLRDVDQLAVLAAASPSRTAFLTDIALDPPGATSDLAGPPLLDEDYLILSTIHSAKGGEWDAVRIIHAADGMIPSDMATGDAASIEEERRLLYVAMTRARDVLEVYFPLRYHRRPRGAGDAHAYSQLTRFIPDGVLGLFDERVAGDQPLSGGGSDAGAGGTAAVDDALRELWAG